MYDIASMRPHGSSVQLERRRQRAVALKEQGVRPTQIARQLGTTLRSVERWLRAHQEAGLEGLKAKPSPGRPPKLTPAQRQDLVQCLLQGASAHGFATDLWSCPRVAELIRCRYGVRYHVDSIPHVLRALHFSPSEAPAPRPRAG
jgi:transposase